LVRASEKFCALQFSAGEVSRDGKRHKVFWFEGGLPIRL
jgi:hypothetical protein